MTDRFDLVARAAQAGADEAFDSFRTDLEVETKASEADLVTEADRRAQRRVIETIREEHPEATVVAEEDREPKSVPETGDAWIVDPIDGTANFARGMRLFATSVAAVTDGKPAAAATVAPGLGDAYLAGNGIATRNGEPVSVSDESNFDRFAFAALLEWEGRDEFGTLVDAASESFAEVRRLGSAQVTLAMVAGGEIDAAFSPERVSHPWDTVAGVHLIRRAGGTVTDIEGNPWRFDSVGLVASNGTVHERLRKRILDAVDAPR